MYLCKLNYKLTNLETCIKTENKACHATAVQRKKTEEQTLNLEKGWYTLNDSKLCVISRDNKNQFNHIICILSANS